MTDNINLIEEIARKQAQLLMDFDTLKEDEIRDYNIIEAIQKQQAELADEFNHWFEKQQIEKGEKGNDKF